MLGGALKQHRLGALSGSVPCAGLASITRQR
jgi:hypothetical protein